MKAFLEEYGFAILAAIVVIILIAIASPVGQVIKQSVSNTAMSQSSKVESDMAEKVQIDNMQVTLTQVTNTRLRIMVKSDSSTDRFRAQYRYAHKKTVGTGWDDFGADWKDFEGEIADDQHGNYHTGHSAKDTPMNGIEVGSRVQVRVQDVGKNNGLWQESNIIIWRDDITEPVQLEIPSDAEEDASQER